MITLIFAILNSFLIGIAVSLQKLGLDKLRVKFDGFNKKSIKRLAKQLLKARLWMLGTVITLVSALLYTWLLSVEDISVIAPITSLSLIVVFLNSYFFLKEKLTNKQIIGFMFLVTGNMLMGLSI